MSSQSATHTWASLLTIVPAPTPAELERYAVDTPPGDLIERGAKIRSEKILTDLVRIGGITADFYSQATTQQKRHLLGFSTPLLNVFVHSGKKLADMLASRDANVDEREASRAAAIAMAEQAYTKGIDERDRLSVALDGIEYLDPALAPRIAAARSKITDHESLANSLHALVNLTKELLAPSSSRIAQQLEDGGLSTSELETISSVADAVKTTGDQAKGARKLGSVSQADLDLQDGTCLAHMERVMKIFNHAHERDASIPRLLPIATRRMFSFGRKRTAEAPPEPAQGNTP